MVATALVLINATLAGNRIWETSLGFRPPPKFSICRFYVDFGFCFFWGGLEIKPCESRLEFVHTPKKFKKTSDQKTEKNNQRGRKKYIACKINCFTFFFGLWSRGTSRDFFLIHFPALMDFKGKKSIARFFLVISILIYCSLR